MRNVTDSKTISGQILKIGRSQQYCTNWGEMLFKSREVIVCVKTLHWRQKIPMYIRDDSDVDILNWAPETLLNKVWNLNVHGKLNTPKSRLPIHRQINTIGTCAKTNQHQQIF